MEYDFQAIQEVLNSCRPIDQRISKSIQEDLLLRFTQESNAIEGNSLTILETKVLLEFGLIAKGKPLKDHIEIQNHQYAVDYLNLLLEKKEPLKEADLKNFNAILLKRTDEESESGRYRSSRVIISGANHRPLDPLHVAEAMRDLVEQYNQEIKDLRGIDIVKRIARLHANFVAIHPFIDGNGRTGRLLMNLELQKHGFPLVILSKQDRSDYYDALALADQHHYESIEEMIVKEVVKTSIFILGIIDGKWMDRYRSSSLA